MRLFPRLKPRYVSVPSNPLFKNGMSVYPFIFLTPTARPVTEIHERVHHRQQDAWWKWGGPFGLLAWYFLYLLVLPVGWNPWRYKWEAEAFWEAQGYRRGHILDLMRQNYLLWWMGDDTV